MPSRARLSARADYYRAYDKYIALLSSELGSFKVVAGQFIFPLQRTVERYNAAAQAMTSAGRRVAELEADMKKQEKPLPEEWMQLTGAKYQTAIGATDIMERSKTRILTTHTGSLPRPPALTKLYAMRSRGENVDAGEIERAGHASMQEIVPGRSKPGSTSATTASSSAKASSSTSATE